MTITIVDMGISNIASVLQALRQVDAPPHRFADPSNLMDASAIILPGVGAFGDGMASLRKVGLVEPLCHAAKAGIPFFGICLGMQLMADHSEEFGTHEGLGLVSGQVKRLVADGANARVPNIGWCDVTPPRTSVLFPDAAPCCMYHIHSYHLIPTDQGIVTGTISFANKPVVVAIEHRNLFGVQFHTEKSQADGLDVLARFLQALPRLNATARG